MKTRILVLLLASCLLFSFSFDNLKPTAIRLKGTWQLVSATTITKGKSVTTDYRKNERMIKIINDTHFSMLLLPHKNHWPIFLQRNSFQKQNL
ncbi:hypothetical protein [uncultured Mucilaginibacter sp.]|uniref:hypothetical protein n=1 Tax=uncultured Mucilaginibacter sp. TaxID=797541 RepID=UPI0026355C8E|nr:hypothetical protein [uncultured Mucilaginibacter sp.]